MTGKFVQMRAMSKNSLMKCITILGTFHREVVSTVSIKDSGLPVFRGFLYFKGFWLGNLK